ncbi:MAG: Hsp33 family molecular chaperone HslO [Lachnospiraceae bacterium]|nr:Hsp33 family molecular chaperone HslO [Lachnospiraceae bacterium]
MSDYIIRATAADDSIRAFAINSKDMVETARRNHSTTPVVTAALGRLLSGCAMMGTMLKGENDVLTIQIQSSGPAKGLVVTADPNGNVKGYPMNPYVDIPLKRKGKLDVGGAMGIGVMSVIKDMGLKEPYVGQIALQTGEIGDDLTYYFATSEQIPSSVGLGVLIDTDESVKQAGGFIIQLMPFTDEAVISKLEEKIANISSVTEMLDKGMTPEDILEDILGDFGVKIQDKIECGFNCNCGKERISKVLASLSKKEMDEMIEANEPVEIKCHFCNKAYMFDVDDLKKIRGVK